MGNPIKFDEFVDKQSIVSGFNDLSKLLKKTEKDLINTAKSIKKATEGIKLTDKDAAVQLEKNKEAVKGLRKEVDLNKKAQDQLTAAQNRLRISQSKVGIETAKLRDATQRQNRLTKQEITLNRSKEGSMLRLSTELAKNRQRYRELSAAQRANVNIGGQLIATIKQQDANIKQLDASIGNNQRSVGDYGIALKGVTKLLGALGLAGGIALVVRGVREMIGVFSGFEKQMAKVRAVSGATDKEFELLNEDAKRLGESTEKTASQVGELQLAYAKLGFTTPQIIAATEATLNLATAIDEDLAQSALVAAKTTKGFNLAAEDTIRVTDVMALAFSSSALNLNAFQDAMKTVAPVALAVNSTLEATTAILSSLVDAGLDASTAGTSLRNIFIELETQGLTWDEAMQQVRDSTNKVKTATELFGKRASTAALIIANNSEKIDTLTASYENAAGSAQVMADIMRDTLTGDVDRATSALEGMIIQIGDKLIPILRSIVKGFIFFISNIGSFIKILLVATSTIVSYRLAIKLSTLLTNQSTKATILKTLAEKVSAIGQKVLRGALLLTAAAQALMTGNVKRATTAMRVFNKVTKLNPLGLLLGILAAVTTAFFAYRDSTDAATKAQEEFTGKHKEFLDQLAQEQAQLVTLFDAAITAKEGTEERSFAIGEINRLYGEYLPNLLTEASTLTEIAAASEIANKALLQNLAIKSRQAEITESNTKLINAQREAEDLVRVAIEDAGGTITEQSVALRRFNDVLKESNETIQEITGPDGIKRLVVVGDVAIALKSLAEDFGLTTTQVESAIFKIIQAQKNAAESIAETKDFYDQFIDALGLTKVAVDDTEEALKSLIKIQERLLKQAKLLPETTEKELIVKNRKIKAINTEIKRLKALGIEQGKQIDLDKIRQQITLARARNLEDELNRVKATEDAKFKIRKDNLKKERDALIRQGGDKLQITELFENLITELTIEHQRERLEKLRAVKIKNEQETNADILKELETFFLQQGMTEDEISKQLLDTKEVFLQKEIQLRKDIGAEIIDQELELARLRRKIADREAEEQRKREEELKEIRDFAIEEAVRALQKRADAALKAADEEVAATEKQISRQELLAAQGLENSLKFEQEQRAEALLQKIEAEKQKERAEKISAFWNLVSNSDSIQEAIVKFGFGEAFARSIDVLPGFEDGDLTPKKKTLAWVSEKGEEFIVQNGPAQDYLPQLRAMNSGTYDDTFGARIDNSKFIPENVSSTSIDIQSLVAETKGMRRELKDIVPKIETSYEASTHTLITLYRSSNKTKIIRQKLPRL